MRGAAREGGALPIAALVGACFVWGSTFALVKMALRDADALSFIALRFAVALAALLLFSLRSFRRVSAGEWYRGAVTGAALYGAFFFQTQGLRFTSAANSAFITGLCVVMVPFLLWAGGRRPGRAGAAAAAVGAAGLYILSGADFQSTSWGDLLTLVCAFLFALHIICLGVFGRRVAAFRLFAVQIATAAALAAAGGLAWGGTVRWSGALVATLLVTGLLATALCFFLQTWAQRRLEPARASIWFLTEPVFALGFGYAILGESLSLGALLGAALILAGVVLSEGGLLTEWFPAYFPSAAGTAPLPSAEPIEASRAGA